MVFYLRACSDPELEVSLKPKGSFKDSTDSIQRADDDRDSLKLQMTPRIRTCSMISL